MIIKCKTSGYYLYKYDKSGPVWTKEINKAWKIWDSAIARDFFDLLARDYKIEAIHGDDFKF